MHTTNAMLFSNTNMQRNGLSRHVGYLHGAWLTVSGSIVGRVGTNMMIAWIGEPLAWGRAW